MESVPRSYYRSRGLIGHALAVLATWLLGAVPAKFDSARTREGALQQGVELKPRRQPAFVFETELSP